MAADVLALAAVLVTVFGFAFAAALAVLAVLPAATDFFAGFAADRFAAAVLPALDFAAAAFDPAAAPVRLADFGASIRPAFARRLPVEPSTTLFTAFLAATLVIAAAPSIIMSIRLSTSFGLSAPRLSAGCGLGASRSGVSSTGDPPQCQTVQGAMIYRNDAARRLLT
ncbi:hypothetical protein D4Q52_04840 [Rhodopseudomonas palustris]|uniref:Uncharacterized protein n=1 Tax=Rhodopseudomonas palustris TaxID=1076 RepID=A0A418VLV3_RHOPL|nr:hypothetical protein D4Q52_04840 [Rhodopseudomonas palustris]